MYFCLGERLAHSGCVTLFPQSAGVDSHVPQTVGDELSESPVCDPYELGGKPLDTKTAQSIIAEVWCRPCFAL